MYFCVILFIFCDQWKRQVRSQPTIGRVGSPLPYIFLTAIQLGYTLSAIKPLKFTFNTSIFRHDRVQIFLEESLSYALFRLYVTTRNGQHIQYLLSYTWYMRVVQSLRCSTWSTIIHEFSISHLTSICLTRSTPLPWRSTNILRPNTLFLDWPGIYCNGCIWSLYGI